MDVFNVFRTVLVVVLSVTILVPINIPLAALAYKLHRGNKPLPMEPTPFWIRSTFVALGLAALSVAVMYVDYALVVSFGFPAGFVHITMLMVYVAVSVWYMFWLFALDELLEGFSVFVMYIGIPSLLLAFLLISQRWWPVPLVEGFVLPAA